MTEQDEFTKRQPFPGWIIKEEIGRGSFGTVYRAERDGFSTAIKYMVIPDERGYREAFRKLGSNEKVSNYYKPMAERLYSEIRVMQNLQGASGIVLYLDHEMREMKDRAGWEICIRMEYLTPLNEWIYAHGISVRQVLSIAVQLSIALAECASLGVIHRDIKESNILLDAKGRTKLGDFGISKNLEGTEMASTFAGTHDYMAPEVINRQKYDFHADMYSLGVVVFRLLNGGRMPFTPENYTVDDMEMSRQRLQKGDILPDPQFGGSACGELLRKACAYDPKDRFQDFQTLQTSLEQLMKTIDPAILDAVTIAASGESSQASVPDKSEKQDETSGTFAINYDAHRLTVHETSAPTGTVYVGYNPADVSSASVFEINKPPVPNQNAEAISNSSVDNMDTPKKILRWVGIVFGVVLLILTSYYGILINLSPDGSRNPLRLIAIGCTAVFAALWGLICLGKIGKHGRSAGILAAVAYFVLAIGGLVL
jgi:serine/threonine protein kinase